MKNDDDSPLEADCDEAPPILGTWKNVYALVLISLVVSIVLFYAFTLYFA
ncbi:hypothetical protein [Emticicia aquatilis]|nr:hypothetical protein [Emticicia aquatilis]